MAKSVYSFKIIVAGLNPEDDDFENRFFEAGCDDATLSVQNGEIAIDFVREAFSESGAIILALDQLNKMGATIIRMETESALVALNTPRAPGA